MAVLHAAAFWFAALIFLARTPYVLRNPLVGRPGAPPASGRWGS
ncbi:hypothetical protein NYQ25_00630 [Curtobacterium flaccumfaciens pv. flaccumfaciens]|nr:hypothetical protein [Curtobacterium flaccumfaciens]MCS6583471.1 hypothetical protein [Curtobacterium flaccumfaciens pv. flaccumfaciens]